MYKREGKAARVAMIKEQRPGLKDYDRINWRLTQEWEVPDWVKVRPPEKDEEQTTELGKRQRNEFVNPDNISDQRYLQYIQEGKDPYEA